MGEMKYQMFKVAHVLLPKNLDFLGRQLRVTRNEVAGNTSRRLRYSQNVHNFPHKMPYRAPWQKGYRKTRYSLRRRKYHLIHYYSSHPGKNRFKRSNAYAHRSPATAGSITRVKDEHGHPIYGGRLTRKVDLGMNWVNDAIDAGLKTKEIYDVASGVGGYLQSWMEGQALEYNYWAGQ